MCTPRRADDGDEDAPPGLTVRGIERLTQSLGNQDEGHHHQPHHRTDDQSEYEEDLIFIPLGELSDALL